MSTVRNALAEKSGALIHVRSGDMVVEALRQMPPAPAYACLWHF